LAAVVSVSAMPAKKEEMTHITVLIIITAWRVMVWMLETT
jgi:hypothetical protein